MPIVLYKIKPAPFEDRKGGLKAGLQNKRSLRIPAFLNPRVSARSSQRSAEDRHESRELSQEAVFAGPNSVHLQIDLGGSLVAVLLFKNVSLSVCPNVGHASRDNHKRIMFRRSESGFNYARFRKLDLNLRRG
jgi:hypothetical protein